MGCWGRVGCRRRTGPRRRDKGWGSRMGNRKSRWRSSHTPGIFAIVHAASGRAYVGMTKDLLHREKSMWGALCKGSYTSKDLQSTFLQEGEATFRWEVLEECPEERLVERKQYWMDTLHAAIEGFNRAPEAGTLCGLKRTVEERAAIGQRVRGMWGDPVRRAHLLSLYARPLVREHFLTAHRDPEYRARRSADQRRIWENPTYQAARSATMRVYHADPKWHTWWLKRRHVFWADPEWRARCVLAMKEGSRNYWADSTRRETLRETRSRNMLAKWADPAWRDWFLHSVFYTPTVRQAMSAGQRRRWEKLQEAVVWPISQALAARGFAQGG